MCWILHVAISSDNNIKSKATEKMTTYVDLHTECQGMWDKTVEEITTIMGATAVLERNLKKYLK